MLVVGVVIPLVHVKVEVGTGVVLNAVVLTTQRSYTASSMYPTCSFCARLLHSSMCECLFVLLHNKNQLAVIFLKSNF